MEYIERDTLLAQLQMHADLFKGSTLRTDIARRDEALTAVSDVINAPAADVISKQDVLDALEREREYLLANGMNGAEHILVHHAINVIKDL